MQLFTRGEDYKRSQEPKEVDSDMVNTRMIPIADLHQDPSNVRKHSVANINAISESLKQFGQRKPLVVQGSRIIAGNGTYQAAQALGWTEISVTDIPDDWDASMAQAYAIADNQTATLAEWDELELAAQLEMLEAEGMSLVSLGFAVNEATQIPMDQAFENLPTGERDNATQMTFTMTLDQAEQIKAAIRRCKTMHNFDETDNSNSNGNALWAICKDWDER
jgi:ParB-like chromosome segregation protein Spo0J